MADGRLGSSKLRCTGVAALQRVWLHLTKPSNVHKIRPNCDVLYQAYYFVPTRSDCSFALAAGSCVPAGHYCTGCRY